MMSCLCPPRRPPRGFTLVEILAALIIFSVAVVAIIQSLGTAVAFQADLAMRQRATMLARNVMEEIRYTGDLREGDEEGDYEDTDAGYHWRTDIAETDTPDLYDVKVTISWNQGRNAHDVELSTFMYKQAEGTPL
jgi:general secretion pathway protein I